MASKNPLPKTLSLKDYSSAYCKIELPKLFENRKFTLKVITKDDHYIILSPEFKGERTITIPGSFHNMKYSEVEPKLSEKLKKNEFKDEKEKDEAHELLALEHRVHLMPKPEYFISIVALLLEALEHDPELQTSLCSFKVRCRPLTLDQAKNAIENNKSPSQITLFPGLGKGSATKILHKIYALFAEYSANNLGLDLDCSHYRKVNALIAFSEGNHDLRDTIVDPKSKSLLAKHQDFYKKHLKIPHPAFNDLKLLHAAMNSLCSLSSKLVEATIVMNDEVFTTPHLRLWCHITPKPKSHDKLLELDEIYVNQLYFNVFKPIDLNIHSFGKEAGDSFLRIPLPDNLLVIRDVSFQETLINLAKQHFASLSSSSSSSSSSSRSRSHFASHHVHSNPDSLSGHKRKAAKHDLKGEVEQQSTNLLLTNSATSAKSAKKAKI